MLTLRLKSGEYMTIGDKIAVQIFRVTGDSVEVAVKAPREIPVLRGEVYERTGSRPQGIKASPKPDAAQLRREIASLRRQLEKLEGRS